MPKSRCQKPNAKYCMPKKNAKNQMLKKCKHDLSSISTHRESDEI